MTPPRNLEGLERWLGSAVGEAVQSALAIEQAGASSPEWAALLARFEVTPTPEADRLRAATATSQRFGASPDELYGVLTRLAKDGDEALQAIPLPDDGPGERRWRRLQGLLGRLREETVAAYRKRVMPKRSMFSQALEAARPGGNAPQKRETFVLRCAGCGAPRLKENVFTCEYCDTPYGGEGS